MNTFRVQAVIFKASSFILNITVVRRHQQVLCAWPGGTERWQGDRGEEGAGSFRGYHRCRRQAMLLWGASPAGSSSTLKRQLLASPVAAAGSNLHSQDSSKTASAAGKQASMQCGELPPFVCFPAVPSPPLLPCAGGPFRGIFLLIGFLSLSGVVRYSGLTKPPD